MVFVFIDGFISAEHDFVVWFNVIDFWFDHCFFAIVIDFFDRNRRAVPILVSEKLGGFSEVNNCEKVFVIIRSQTSATADDLFELSH